MRWIWETLRVTDFLTAVVAVVASLAAMATGKWLMALAFLIAGALWLLVSRHWHGKVVHARRQRDLRRRRHEREAAGLAPLRDD